MTSTPPGSNSANDPHPTRRHNAQSNHTGAPEIVMPKSNWRRHQSASSSSSSAATKYHPSSSMDSSTNRHSPPATNSVVAHKKTKVPMYTQKPEPRVRIREGSGQLFRCAVKEEMKFNYWTKDGNLLFDHQMIKADNKTAERFTFIGDMKKFDYAIELSNAQVEDSGLYECHTYTAIAEYDNPFDFLVGSNLTVEPIPAITQSPSALASEMNEHVEASTQQQLQHSQRSTILSHASMPQSSLQSEPALQTVNLIQPPSHMLTRLPPPTRLLSARNSSSNSLKLDARLGMPIFWPYLLLALAAILMLTNIYLIYSLVRRHTKRRRSDLESPSGERKLSTGRSESFSP
jgi:hypothetical protein